MAAGILSPPDTPSGPCRDCDHDDCEAVRRFARKECSWCGQPIGYSTRFYEDGEEAMHAVCEELAIEEGRA